jgi:hypothetical protein
LERKKRGLEKKKKERQKVHWHCLAFWWGEVVWLVGWLVGWLGLLGGFGVGMRGMALL